MLLLRIGLKNPDVSESIPVPWHSRSISPSSGLHPLGTMRTQCDVLSGWASKLSPAAGENVLASATPENVGNACVTLPSDWCHLRLTCLHPSPIISALRVSHQRWVLTLLLEKAFLWFWSSFKSAGFHWLCKWTENTVHCQDTCTEMAFEGSQHLERPKGPIDG